MTDDGCDRGKGWVARIDHGTVGCAGTRPHQHRYPKSAIYSCPSQVPGAAQNRAEETKNDATSHQSGVRGLVDDAKNKATELGNRASEKTTEAKHSAQESGNKAANIADEQARQ